MNWGGVPPTTELLSSPEPELAREDVFDVLSNARRRQILHYLKRQDDRKRIDLRELVDHVAAWENDKAIEEVTAVERKRVYTALRQSHLPKMDQAGVIVYDNMRAEVELTEAAREAQLYLEYIPEQDISWNRVYLGLTAIFATIVVLVWLGVYPFVGLSGLMLATLIVVTFAITAVTHAVETAKNRLGSDVESIPADAPEP